MRPAQRIISLAPHLTELVFAAGAGNKLIATSTHSDYPPPARKLPVVANHYQLDLEAIIKLKPDLVLLWETAHTDAQQQTLQRFNIPIYRHAPHKIEDIATTLRHLGQLAHTSTQANRAATHFLQTLAHLKHRYQTRRPVTAFLQIASHPLMTVNAKTLLSQAVALCGAQSLFGNVASPAFSVDIESVLAADPDFIIMLSAQNPWTAWPQLRATRQHHLISANPDLLGRYGPRLLQGVQALCETMS